MFGSNAWVLIPIAAIFAGVFTSWIHAKHGRRYNPWGGFEGKDEDRHARREDVIKQIDEAIASRDETIAQLEERVRVLERIVTDRAHRLNEEIDRLGRT